MVMEITAVADETRDDTVDRLLRQVAAGEHAAFAELYDQLSADVFGLVLRFVPDTARAGQILQQAFLAVWQQAGAFTASRDSAISWVYVIAYCLALDGVRRSR